MSDLSGLTSWNADWKGVKVLVVGLGVTGFSVADTLWELGCDAFVVTASASDEHTTILDVIGVAYSVTPDESEMVRLAAAFEPDVIVVSPGIPPQHPIVSWAATESIQIWSDIELAWRVRDKVLNHRLPIERKAEA